MNADKYFYTTSNRENYYHQVSSNEIVHEKDTTNADNSFSLIAIVVITLLAAIASNVISLYRARSRFPKASGNFPKAFKSSTHKKCTNCRFFDSNSYLKCAVHPTKVLKKEAPECLDYEAMLSKKDRHINQ